MACFYVTISEKFEHFQYFNFGTDFLENENFFQKTGVPFLVERTKIEKASFPYKANVYKLQRMLTTKWAHHRERSFTSNYFFFVESFVSV